MAAHSYLPELGSRSILSERMGFLKEMGTARRRSGREQQFRFYKSWLVVRDNNARVDVEARKQACRVSADAAED